MKTKAAVEKLLEDHNTGVWFTLLCESGTEAIKVQASQLHEVLQQRGHECELQEVEDAMLELAHELLPDSPAGEDPRQTLFRELGVWASRQSEDVQDCLQIILESSGKGTLGSFQDAWDGPLSGFRAYLHEVCKAAIEMVRLDEIMRSA